MGIANNPRWSSKMNVVFEDSGKEDAFSTCRSEMSALQSDEGDADNDTQA